MKSIVLIIAQLLLTFVLYVLGVLILGVALYPSVKIVLLIWVMTGALGPDTRLLCLSLGLIFGYFIFGLSSLILVGLVRFLSRIQLREGDYKIGHPMFIKWFFVNALFLSVKTIFMDFMLLTPLCPFFYRLMGARIGLNVQINSKNVADHSLLEIGDNSVIGGNATVIAHLFGRKGLTLRKVRIGKNVIIGLNSVVFPGSTIGDNVVIAAGAIVPRDTVIEQGSVYYGPNQRTDSSKAG